MSAAPFLISLGQCLATMNLYADGHPARERALDASHERLQELLAGTPHVDISFVGSETVVGEHAVPELATWEWGARLASVGVERIEIADAVGRDHWERFVDEVWHRLAGRPDGSAEARQLAVAPIRWGPLAVRRAAAAGGIEGLLETQALSLLEESSAVSWIHGEVVGGARLPMAEVDAVVQALGAAMRAERRAVLPLLELKRFDQYTTTHAINVSVLSMGLAEKLGLGRAEVRSFGVAGLLHDIGKVRIPHELLTKPGKLTEEEREVIQRHPVEGARIVMERERGLGLAAVVAYEHHVCIDGTGYPKFRYARDCHLSSRIVHVCDIYDALCTDRPYRDAWESERALGYLESRAGTEVDVEVTRVFCAMVRESLSRRIEATDPVIVTA